MAASYAETIPDAQSPFASAHEHAVAVEKALSGELQWATHAELEAYAEKEGREWMRLMLQGHLDLRAANEQPAEVVGADGAERRVLRRGTQRQLRTVVGDVTVERWSYGATDVARSPNGPFADWHSLGGNVSQPFAIHNQDGRISASSSCAWAPPERTRPTRLSRGPRRADACHASPELVASSPSRARDRDESLPQIPASKPLTADAVQDAPPTANLPRSPP